MESYGKDVAAVVDKLKLDKVILIGHSLGGLVCIEAALNLQDKVIGIIGLDCLNEFEKKWSEEEIKGFLDWFRTNTKKRIYDYVRFGMFRKDIDSMLIERYASDIASVAPNVFFSELENWLNYQNEKFLGSVVNISVPISCIQNGDNVVTVETNKRYNPQYQGVRMDSLLHMFIVAYPDPVNREIEKMINYITSR
jgi:pimeloyl-ACP methyl ester carboxylesterase